MKKDASLIALFVALGVGIAWFSSGPLRSPSALNPPAHEFAPQAGLYAEGVVSLARGFTSKAPALFIIARPAEGGIPLAVKRVASPVFPVTFFLSAADQMVPGPFHDGDITVIARLDADGSAGPAQPGDVEISAFLKAGGDRSLQLVLDGKTPTQK